MPPKSKTKASSAAISKSRQDNKTRNGVSKRNKNPLRKKTPISNNTNGQKKKTVNRQSDDALKLVPVLFRLNLERETELLMRKGKLRETTLDPFSKVRKNIKACASNKSFFVNDVLKNSYNTKIKSQKEFYKDLENDKPKNKTAKDPLTKKTKAQIVEDYNNLGSQFQNSFQTFKKYYETTKHLKNRVDQIASENESLKEELDETKKNFKTIISFAHKNFVADRMITQYDVSIFYKLIKEINRKKAKIAKLEKERRIKKTVSQKKLNQLTQHHHQRPLKKIKIQLQLT